MHKFFKQNQQFLKSLISKRRPTTKPAGINITKAKKPKSIARTPTITFVMLAKKLIVLQTKLTTKIRTKL